jgi:putative phosphoesterase
MKALILSDLHSNIYALEAIWKKEHDSDLVLCAGDTVDYGPYPNEVIAWLQEHNAQCVQGNHDAWVATSYRKGETLESAAEEERAWYHLNASLLGKEDIQFLENLPVSLTFELDGIVYGMQHIYRDYREIVSLHAYEQFRAQAFDSGLSDRISRLILGHTHRQSVRYLSDELLWLNPGSASYRRHDDPDQTTHYITITDGEISLKRLAYDFSPLTHFVDKIRLKESEMEVARFFFRSTKI